MTISEFKAHAQHVLGQVAKTREPVVVTKRGKPLVEVVPFRNTGEVSAPGRLSETLVFATDIVSPIDEPL
ncbi:MAG: type II toxin-antitoxin system Phd/YefM family antitoxin [Candidatus Hydrogenedentes bacterium]|nr:type II toxin-antitoxin system Phd/YefM family antitoxin [Candidatus Hydrogenedentota bacterium]